MKPSLSMAIGADKSDLGFGTLQFCRDMHEGHVFS